MNLDRFSQGLADAQNELPLAECAFCGFEIYEGDEYFESNDGQPCCFDVDCLAKLAGAVRLTAEGGRPCF